ncbi:MAG: LysM peptidoglycan-binding domain-containing protein [Alphaproteobacteria bacterium]|nr:LysM peptidoglycan-binding domain-containing protein [Alphaproteobacteria bacterium]
MFKKSVLTLAFCMCLAGCAPVNNGIQLIGSYYNKVFGAPDTVQVKKGDTLYSIAKRYDMSIMELIELNGLDSPNQLYVGQVLKTNANKYYTVKRGDTLASIARKYGTSWQSLAQKNNIKPPYALNVGQKIAVSGTAPKTYATNSKQVAGKTQTNMTSKAKTSTASSSAAYVSTKRNAKFVWPVSGKVISSFGKVGKGLKNDGINISAPLGTTVKAGDKGTVAYAGNGLKGFGNLILIKHPDGYITAYAHNDKILVKKGQSVARGEKIATVGKTGGVSAPQLHFEVRAGKKAVNPRNYLP